MAANHELVVHMHTNSASSTSCGAATGHGHGWSDKIKDYILIERLGQRVATQVDPLRRFYGATAAVYRARLTDAAKWRAIINGVPSHDCEHEFAVKIGYVYDERDALHLQTKVKLSNPNRLKRHPNISTIYRYFIDTIPSEPYPIDWTADMSLVQPKALFIVMELLSSFSLQHIIPQRHNHGENKRTINDNSDSKRSLLSAFKPSEILMVARDISNGICHLHSNGIAHRDIKPENIMFRLPTNITTKDAMKNLALDGISVVLCDFGEAFDFLTLPVNQQPNDSSDMKRSEPMPRAISMMLPLHLARAGAPQCRPPEHSLSNGDGVMVSYDKSDIWSLGRILSTIINTKMDHTSNNASNNNHSSQLMDIIMACVEADPSKRLSCYDAHRGFCASADDDTKQFQSLNLNRTSDAQQRINAVELFRTEMLPLPLPLASQTIDTIAAQTYLRQLKLKYAVSHPRYVAPSDDASLAMNNEYEVADKLWTGWSGNNIDHCNAVKVFSKLAAMGHIPSIHRMGDAWQFGKGMDILINPDITPIAEPWLDMKWVKVTEYGRGRPIPEDHLPQGMIDDDPFNYWYQPAITNTKKSFDYYHTAARMGYPPSEYELSACYEYGYGCDTDKTQGMKWLEIAASHDHCDAINWLGQSVKPFVSIFVPYSLHVYQ